MTDLAILVPVLARSHRVVPFLESVYSATPGNSRVLFICDPDDEAEKRAVRGAGAEMLEVDGGYARKINEGVRATTEGVIFLAADDLKPHPDWLDTAMTYLRDSVQVVGVNDLIRRQRERKATHFLLTREYAEQPTIDGGPGPLCELYSHSWVDDEFAATATHRGVYAYAEDAVVEHVNHPMMGGEDDDTYRRGRQQFRQDRRIFHRRAALWT